MELSTATEAPHLVHTHLPTVTWQAQPPVIQGQGAAQHESLWLSQPLQEAWHRPWNQCQSLLSLSLSNQPTTFTEFFFLFFPRPTYIGKAAVTSSFWGHYTYSCPASLLSELRPWTRQHHQACFHKKSKRKSQRDSCPGGLGTRGNLCSFRTTTFRQPAKRWI